MALPGFDYQTPPQQPAHSGLYDAATVDPTSGERIAGGVRIWPVNCGPSGTWPSDICAPPLYERVLLTLTGATTGTFDVTVLGDTATINWDATPAEVEADLEALPRINDVIVTGTVGAWTVEFRDPSGNIPAVTVDDSDTDGTAAVTVTQQGFGKGGDRPDTSLIFEPVTAWGYDECGDLSATDHATRAQTNLAINEHLYVESSFATRILSDAGAPAASVNLWDAVAQLEAALAEDGLIGAIHASTYWTTIALGLGLITKQGAMYRTSRGTAWADGGGYDGILGNTLVATGQVFLWRDAITVSETFSHQENLKLAVAERTVLAAYEPCHASAVAVPALTAGGGGGGGNGLLYPSA